MSFIGDLTGTWQMDYDGWTGTLVVNPSDQFFNMQDGNCHYSYYAIDGTWSGGAGNNLGMTGTLGGGDTNHRTGEPCPSSAHKVAFTIAFPGAAPQPFEGYIFTHRPNLMGFTSRSASSRSPAGPATPGGRANHSPGMPRSSRHT